MKKSNERTDEIKRRLMPIATHLADLFGFQKTAKDSTYSADEVEVPSNLWNSLESLATWLENLLTQKEGVDGDSIHHLDQYWMDIINELHSHMFQNYNRWVAYTGLVDGLGRIRRRRTTTLLSVYMTDANELWSRESREQTAQVELNAKLHHLCLWFLIYGESANLRHTSESLCFIFHAALRAVTLEGRRPNEGEELVLCKPVSEEVMPYEEKDFLRTIVTPLYLFLKKEIAERAQRNFRTSHVRRTLTNSSGDTMLWFACCPRRWNRNAMTKRPIISVFQRTWRDYPEMHGCTSTSDRSSRTRRLSATQQLLERRVFQDSS